MTSIVWTLGAEADAQRIYDDVLFTTRLSEAFPRIGPVVYRDVLRIFVFNRNYGLYYVVEARGIILHALLDLRQDPLMITRRLEEI